MRRAGASGTPPADAPQTRGSLAHLMRMQSAVVSACISATIWKRQRVLPPRLDTKIRQSAPLYFLIWIAKAPRDLAKFEHRRRQLSVPFPGRT